MIQTVQRTSSKKVTDQPNNGPTQPNKSGFGGKGYRLNQPSPSSSEKKLPVYTWEQVAAHNTKESAWVYAGNKVYDITAWIDKHPGGSEALVLCAGRDVTDLIVTYHPFGESEQKAKSTLEKYLIGEIEVAEFPQYKPDQGFYREVRSRVGAYFTSNGLDYKNPVPGFLRLLFMFLVAGVCQYIIISSSYHFIVKLLAAAIFGCFQALPLLHTMHDCSHLAFSRAPTAWKIMGRLTMDYFAGASMHSWHHQHVVGHHVYTNVAGADPDLPVMRSGDPRRLITEQSYFSIYRFQQLYLLVLYGVLAIKFRIQDITGTLIEKSNGPIRVNIDTSAVLSQMVSKSVWAIWRILIPLYYLNVDSTVFWTCFLVSEFATGYYLTFNFQVSHISPGALYPHLSGAEHGVVVPSIEWAQSQMLSSVEYAHGSSLATFLCGALNYQAVHHLFPSVSQYYYPAIAPIVASVASKYNVPYFIVPSFWEAFKLHYQHLKQMGATENPHAHIH